MKVLLIDDHPLILSALQTVIPSLGDDVTVVGVETADAARQSMHDAEGAGESFDLVLMDLSLGPVSGFDLLAEFRATWPAVPVVVLSASERSSDVIRAVDSGAMGFVSKRGSTERLFEALRTVMSGGMCLPPSMLGLSTGHGELEGDTVPSVMRRSTDQPAPAPHPPHPSAESLESVGLTPRQTEVLMLLLQGLPNKLIARRLDVSVETVKDHVAAVLRALGVSTRTQAVVAVTQMTQGQGGRLTAAGSGAPHSTR